MADATLKRAYFEKLPVGAVAAARSCFCTGPQNGEPLCRCRMRSVRVVDGRYVETIDHGPAHEGWRA